MWLFAMLVESIMFAGVLAEAVAAGSVLLQPAGRWGSALRCNATNCCCGMA